ncbi:hypothetical protein N7507_007409 [Penicillium longicatenatum]|nr:hypothetical protein N7507_007409 [Penicillium longicatenatum]
MQFKLSNVFGLFVVANTALAVNVATSLDGYSALAKDVDTTAQKIQFIDSYETGPVRNTTSSKIHYLEQHKAENKGYQEFKGGSVPTDEQQAACNSYTNFASVLTTTLKTTVGKHEIIEATGLTHQMAATLRSVESVTDAIGSTLIKDLLPSCGDSLKDTKKSLDKTLQDAIDAYNTVLPLI